MRISIIQRSNSYLVLRFKEVVYMNNNKNYLYRMELYKYMEDAKKGGLLYIHNSGDTDVIILTDDGAL